MKQLLVATRNRGKIKEIRALLDGLVEDVLCVADLADLPETVEDGATFAENALKKAREACNATGLPTLADDSGLEVDSLGGAPGIHSARYSPEGTSQANRHLLLQNMKALAGKDRRAAFVCVLCWKNETDTLFFEGYSEGLILDKEQGEKGFGYDPVFFDEEMKKTYAELSFEEKISISHRGKALEKWLTYMKNLQ